MNFEIKDNGGAVIYIYTIIIISDLIFNDNLKYICRKNYDAWNNRLLYSIIGNIYLLKYIWLMVTISFVFKSLLHHCKIVKNDLDFSNATFSKTTLLTSGIIFVQLTVYTLIKFILRYFGFKNDYYLVKLMICSSILFLYIYYFLEMNEEKSCEEISDGETAGISLLLIFFVVYLIISTWFIRETIENKYSPLKNVFKFLYFWDDKNVITNDNNNGQGIDNSQDNYDGQENDNGQ